MNLRGKYKTVIAIDPGASGGIAWKTDNTIRCANMPTMTELQTLIGDLPKPIVVIAEKVIIMPKDGENYKFIRMQKLTNSLAEIKTTAMLCGCDYVDVVPRSWQKTLNLVNPEEETPSARKRRLHTFAQQRFPQLKVTLKTCDALNILTFFFHKVETDGAWFNGKLIANQQPKF
jgi:hypothetical protein